MNESIMNPPAGLDYSLTGENATLAIEKGLAEADWYQCPVPRATMRKLLERRDGPAIRDTIVWLALIIGSGTATWLLWGTWGAVLAYLVYAALYAPLPGDDWGGYTGFIHEAVLENHLKPHANPKAVEFYLCGPPRMIKACSKMLSDLQVSLDQIAFDEF